MRGCGMSRTIPHVSLESNVPFPDRSGSGRPAARVCARACAEGRSGRQTRPPPPSLAEIALKRGDCKTASESYAKAASLDGCRPLARRASEVSLRCEHLPAAWESVNRWRSARAGRSRSGRDVRDRGAQAVSGAGGTRGDRANSLTRSPGRQYAGVAGCAALAAVAASMRTLPRCWRR